MISKIKIRIRGDDVEVNETYKIDGLEKPFLSWCKLFNRKPEAIRSMMSLGSSLDEALHTFSNNRELLFKIEDEIRPLQHWCRIYCINFGTALSRLKNGWSYVDSFTKPVRKNGRSRIYRVNGSDYTLEELSVKFNLNQSTIKSRLKTGENIYEALDLDPPDRQKLMDINNMIGKYTMYTLEGRTMTMVEWCEEKQIKITNVQRRLRKGYLFSEAISSERMTNERKYIIDDQEMTLNEIEKKYNISSRVVYKRIHELGYSISDAISDKRGRIKYLFEGQYLSVLQISERTKITPRVLYSRLKKGMSIEDAVSMPASKFKVYTIHNEDLTLGQISKKYAISYKALYNRVVGKKILVEQAVNDILSSL